MVILLTGVGSRLLNQILETRYPPGSFIDALRKLAVVVRGSKPAAVMREWNVPVAVSVPEPNTWREILAATEARPERKIAVQEFGRSSLGAARRPASPWRAGDHCSRVSVGSSGGHRPLREAVRRLAAGQFDVVLFTTSVQVSHLLRIAAEEGLEEQVRAALRRMVVASVGPSTSETLREHDLPVDFEPSHPKMGFLVNEASQRAREILQSKQ